MLRVLFMSLAFTIAAFAANAAVVAEQVVEKEIVVRDADGTDSIQRVKAEKVTPGEQVIYSLRYANAGSDSADGVVLVMPVPAEVTYVEGSVSGSETRVTFSADGGSTYVARGRLTIFEDGVERAARNTEITHIKWTLEETLPPGTKGEISYRGVLQ